MSESISIIVGLVALFSLVNNKWLKLPYTIGIMLLSLVSMTILYIFSPQIPEIFNFICTVVVDSNFEHLLFDGLLSFLLFAGALHINIRDLAKERWSIFLFATLGVVISTFMIGFSMKYIGLLVGLDVPIMYMLLFGAIVSPTDPVAVISILKNTAVSKSLLLKIEGESLFNDGIGVVVFSGILLVTQASSMGQNSDLASDITLLFLKGAVGGMLYGLVLGVIGYRLIKWTLDDAQLVVLISLAIVMTGYAVGEILHVSGPLSMVVCGLYIGNYLDMNHHIKAPGKMLLNAVWEVLDQVFNGILFVLIGLALHLIVFDIQYFTMGLLAIIVVLTARYLSIWSTYSLLKHDETKPSNTVKILTWGGLRGGISIALALSIGEYPYGQGIILMTYTVVIFSILGQGLTLGKLVSYLKTKSS
jgi:CPA1 family monovalent cation:H+ antiporter